MAPGSSDATPNAKSILVFLQVSLVYIGLTTDQLLEKGFLLCIKNAEFNLYGFDTIVLAHVIEHSATII